MWIDRLRTCLWFLLLIGVLGGCVRLQPYHTEPDSSVAGASGPGGASASRTPCYQPAGHAAGAACVRFVEYDDFGNLFNRAQLNETVEAARTVAKDGGIVVVYVHGWEHNARHEDSDLRSFHRAMQSAHTLDRQYGDKRTILGIYVGWRGRSISVPGLSKSTFWERKTTAQSVGDGAVFELFRKLADQREQSPTSRLVLIGHSFGAALTYASVSHSIMHQIIDDPYRAGPDASSTRDRGKRWDMVMLVNPAFEAMQLRPHFELARSRPYLQNQLPHLILITSQADWATRIAFPLGRHFRSLLNKYADPQSADMYRTAIGHYIPFVTHQLTTVKDCARFARSPDKTHAADQLGTVVEAKYFCFGDSRAMLPDSMTKRCPAPVLLTRCDAAGDCAQVAGTHFMDAPDHMPIFNIRTTSDVMSGHNDIWNPTMQAFVAQLLLYIVEGHHQQAPQAGPAIPCQEQTG